LIQVKARMRRSAHLSDSLRRQNAQMSGCDTFTERTGMHSMMADAGVLTGWMMLWNMEMMWLLSGTVLFVATGALVEVVAAIARHRR
jgi:hypothetical protein